jgi:hypothetical protein
MLKENDDCKVKQTIIIIIIILLTLITLLVVSNLGFKLEGKGVSTFQPNVAAA